MAVPCQRISIVQALQDRMAPCNQGISSAVSDFEAEQILVLEKCETTRHAIPTLCKLQTILHNSSGLPSYNVQPPLALLLPSCTPPHGLSYHKQSLHCEGGNSCTHESIQAQDHPSIATTVVWTGCKTNYEYNPIEFCFNMAIWVRKHTDQIKAPWRPALRDLACIRHTPNRNQDEYGTVKPHDQPGTSCLGLFHRSNQHWGSIAHDGCQDGLQLKHTSVLAE